MFFIFWIPLEFFFQFCSFHRAGFSLHWLIPKYSILFYAIENFTVTIFSLLSSLLVHRNYSFCVFFCILLLRWIWLLISKIFWLSIFQVFYVENKIPLNMNWLLGCHKWPLYVLVHVVLFLSQGCFFFLSHQWTVGLLKRFFCIYWYGNVIIIFGFVCTVYYSYRFVCTEPFLHPRDEIYLLMMYDPFDDLLYSIYHYLTGDICICLH